MKLTRRHALAASAAALAAPSLFAQGAWPSVVTMTPQEHDQFFAQERKRWAAVVTAANIRLD